jgi:hypothetical protein
VKKFKGAASCLFLLHVHGYVTSHTHTHKLSLSLKGAASCLFLLLVEPAVVNCQLPVNQVTMGSTSLRNADGVSQYRV